MKSEYGRKYKRGLKNVPPALNLVDHPPHYNFGTIEVIDVIEDWNLDFHCGNAVKYVARAGHKNPETEIQDLEKARWYLNRKIAKLKKPGSATDASTL